MAVAKKKADFGLKVTTQQVAAALVVVSDYIKEREKLLDDDKIADTQTGVKLMAAIQDLAEQVKVWAKSPAENLLNKIRFTLIPTLMESEDIVTIGVDKIGRCRLQDDITCKVEDQDGLHKWLTDNELEDLIKETVNAQTLAAQMRARMKENAEIVDRAMKAGTTEPEEIQKLLKAMPPATVLKITPFVRAQITRE